eukprot:5486571-Lingulodinium_polyedra.AAC.1
MACTDSDFSTAAGAMNVPTEIVIAELQSAVKGAQIANDMANELRAKGPWGWRCGRATRRPTK